MSSAPRKKSPRAPSIPLDEALDRALRAYEKERLHPAPTEVVAQNLGYKSANNGTALASIASLRYFGLLERPKEGQLAVSKKVETFQFSPDAVQKKSLLRSFVTAPPLYADLLQKYQGGLPSDANLKFDLIERGFIPTAAEAAVAVFRKSVDFAEYFSADEPGKSGLASESPTPGPVSQLARHSVDEHASALPSLADDSGGSEVDRIPVRLPGGRRAWLVIPMPFYEADKGRLKAQIDLLLTEDDERD